MKRKHYVNVPLGMIAVSILFLSLPLLSMSSSAPPFPVPPNGSHITATVVEVGVIAPGSLREIDASHATDKPVYPIKLRINTSAALNSQLDTFIVPGKVYEAFSYDALDTKLVGKTIEATLTLKGTTHHARWWISNLRLGNKP